MSEIDQIPQKSEAEERAKHFSFNDFQEMLNNYELSVTLQVQLNALSSSSKENIALFISDLNRGLTGTESTMIHDQTMKIGEKETVNPEDRYQIFQML